MKKRAYIVIAVVALFYLMSYVIFRNSWIEIWSKDQKARPLTYLDSKLTDMRFHIGPHQE